MAAAPATLTPEETLELIRQRIAQNSNDDNLRIRIQRKRSPSAIPEFVCLLDDAVFDHLVNPEPWLVPLAGGGPVFALTVYHAAQPTVAIGTIFVNIDGPPKDIDPAIVRDAAFPGPRKMNFPKEPAPSQSYSNVRQIYPGGPPPSGYNPGYTDPRYNDPRPGNGGGYDPRTADLDRRIAEAERRAQVAEDARREERHRAEMNDARRDAEHRAMKLEQELASLRLLLTSQGQRPPEPAKSNVEVVAALTAALAPVLQAFVQQNAETARFNASISVEAQKASALAAQASAAAQQSLLTGLINKPPDDTALKLLGPTTEAMSSVMNMTMNLMTMMVEQGLTGAGQEQNQMLEAIKEGVKAYAAYQGGKNPPPQRVARRLPATPPPAGALPSGPQVPLLPPPAAPVAPTGATPTPAPAAPTPPAPSGKTIVDEIEADMRALKPPIEIAKKFLYNIAKEPINAQVIATGGDIEAVIANLFAPRLLDFAPTHEDYIREILFEVNKLGVQAGIIEASDAPAPVPAPAPAAPVEEPPPEVQASEPEPGAAPEEEPAPDDGGGEDPESPEAT